MANGKKGGGEWFWLECHACVYIIYITPLSLFQKRKCFLKMFSKKGNVLAIVITIGNVLVIVMGGGA